MLPRFSDRNRERQVVIAEYGDDFDSLAKKVGVDPIDFQKVNADTTQVQAGAAYTVPSKPLLSTVQKTVTPRVPVSFLEQEAAATQRSPTARIPGETDDEYAVRMARMRAEMLPEPTPAPAPEPTLRERFDRWVAKQSNLEPGAWGTPEKAAEESSKIGQWLCDTFGICYGTTPSGQGAIPSGVGMGAGAFLPTTTTQPTTTGAYYPSMRAARGETPLGTEPERVVYPTSIPGYFPPEPSGQFIPSPGAYTIDELMKLSQEVDIPREQWFGGDYGGGKFAEYGFTPLEAGPRGPRMGHAFETAPGKEDLFGGIGEQYMETFVTPGERREMRDEGYRHFATPDLYDAQVDALRGLTRMAAEGDTEGLLEAGAHPWAKQFTVNWLNQFEGADVYVGSDGEIQGVIDWDNIPEGTVDQLVSLGYLEQPGALDVGGGYGYAGKYHYPAMSYYGDQFGDYRRPATLGLVSWSI